MTSPAPTKKDKLGAPAEHETNVAALCERAVELGALAAKPVPPSDVVTGEWVRLKCQFGCDGYGQSLKCPPHSPPPATTRKALDDYDTAILLHLPKDWRQMQKIVATLESEAFFMGYHKAFALGAGPCSLCDTCDLTYPCKHHKEARPSMEACGIDVYRTARNAGLPIEVARDRDCATNYYGLLLVR